MTRRVSFAGREIKGQKLLSLNQYRVRDCLSTGLQTLVLKCVTVTEVMVE